MKITLDLSRRNMDMISKFSGQSLDSLLENATDSQKCDAMSAESEVTAEGGVVTTIDIDDDFIEDVVETFVSPVINFIKMFEPMAERLMKKWFEPTVVRTDNVTISAGRKSYDITIHGEITSKDLEDIAKEAEAIAKYRPEHQHYYAAAAVEAAIHLAGQVTDEFVEKINNLSK